MGPWVRSGSRAVIAAGPRDRAVVMVPFDPDEAWGAKADHPVSGMIGGCRIRTRLVPADRGWVLLLTPKRLISIGIAIGDEVMVELAPEGPQRGDLADDIAAALAANPAAGALLQGSLAARCSRRISLSVGLVWQRSRLARPSQSTAEISCREAGPLPGCRQAGEEALPDHGDSRDRSTADPIFPGQP